MRTVYLYNNMDKLHLQMNKLAEIQKMKDDLKDQIKSIFDEGEIEDISIDTYVTVMFNMKDNVWISHYNIKNMKEKLGLELLNIVMAKKSRYMIFEQIKEVDQ